MPWLAAAGAVAGAAAQMSQASKKTYDPLHANQYSAQMPGASISSILSGPAQASQSFPGGSGMGAPSPTTSLGSDRDYALMHNLSQLNSGGGN